MAMNVIWNGTRRTIDAREGETILTALRRAGIAAPEAPCGGNGTCKKCTVTVDGREVLACRTPVTGDHTVILPEQNAGAVIASAGRGADFPLTPAHGLGAAVDIGTTTVVAHLYDLESGALLGTRSGVNAQRAFGADVISRIQYAMSQPDGLEQLTRAIRGQLNGYLEELCAGAGRGLNELTTVTVAANTVMEHIYAGLSPASIAVAPFTPLSLFGEWQDGGATAELFGEMAAELSADTGSASNGGLYEGINKSTSFVQEFLDWCFAEGRQVGDSGVVDSSYGSHVMYLDSFGAPYWQVLAENQLKNADYTEWLEANTVAETVTEGSGMKYVGY